MRPIQPGDRYGRYVILREVASERPGRHVLCRCDCGTVKVVRFSHLVNGNTSSCGCYKRDLTIATKRTHGQSGTRLYYVWVEMRQRCQNPRHPRYPLYGGRGIRVCDEWKDFERFRSWALANGYRPGLSLDRIDNDGDYEPGNCRWVPQLVQNNNSRRCKMITYRGRTQSLAQWARELGLNYRTLRSRLRIGWSVERAFETPMEGRSRGQHRDRCVRQQQRRQPVHR